MNLRGLNSSRNRILGRVLVRLEEGTGEESTDKRFSKASELVSRAAAMTHWTSVYPAHKELMLIFEIKAPKP